MAETNTQIDAEDIKKNFETDARSASKNKFLLKERFEIDFETPISWLDSNGSKAYRVHDMIDKKRSLFALICNATTAPRSSYLTALKSNEHNCLFNLIEFGTVDNPLTMSNDMSLIYPVPAGGKVSDFKSSDIQIRGNWDHFKHTVLRLLSGVEALKGYGGITHRAIRLDNLYYRDAERKEIILGDCLASFPAFHQPAIYETVESLMSVKEGRGNGSDVNDFYAVGVAILALYNQEEPLSGLGAAEILRLKLKKGSYQALLANNSLPNQVANIIRGLLHDDRLNRWKYIQTYNYLEGKSNTVQTARHERPKKSIVINGEKVYSKKDVIFAMQNNVAESFELLKTGKVLDWIKNGIGDESLSKRIERVLSQDLTDQVRPDVLISKISILINPDLPIKLKDISIFPDGASKAIFYAIKTNGDLAPFYDLYSSELVRIWYQEQESIRSPSNINEFRLYVNSQDLGAGLDRIMYECDKDLPCISPLLGSNFINSSTKVLKAMDSSYSSEKSSMVPFDNNLIAYLRCKLGKKIDAIVFGLNSHREEIQANALLHLFSLMQNKYGPAQLINLGAWLISYSKPIITSYHNSKYKKYLEREILKVNKNGRLQEILEILENVEARKKDNTEFAKITAEVNSLLIEKNKILSNGTQIDEETKQLTLKFTAIVAVALMITSFVFNLLNWAVR